jgi:hypothetical protein
MANRYMRFPCCDRVPALAAIINPLLPHRDSVIRDVAYEVRRIAHFGPAEDRTEQQERRAHTEPGFVFVLQIIG